jgi:hypothetical protein
MFNPFFIVLLLLDFFSKRSLGFLGNQDKFGMGKSKQQRAAAERKKSQKKDVDGKYVTNTNISINGHTISSDGSEVLAVWSSSSSSSSSSSGNSEVNDSGRQRGTLPSDEWEDVYSVTRFLGPKCVPMSSRPYNEDYRDDDYGCDEFVNEDHARDAYGYDGCDSEDCYHDMEEEEDIDDEFEEKWHLISENYVSASAKVKKYREVGNNSGIRGAGTSRSTYDRHVAKDRKLAKAASSFSQPITGFYSSQEEICSIDRRNFFEETNYCS